MTNKRPNNKIAVLLKWLYNIKILNNRTEHNMKNLYNPSSNKRFIFFFFLDILIIILSLYSSFFIRFSYQLRTEYFSARRYIIMINYALPIFLIIKLSIFGLFHLYRITWRYVGVRDLVNLARAVLVAQLILMFIILIMVGVKPFCLIRSTCFIGFPRSIFIIDGFVSFVLLAGVRISKRVFLEVLGKGGYKKGLTTIIIGAGNIGETLVRDMIRKKFVDYYPVAFLDDDKEKAGSYIHGVQVIGEIDKLKEMVKKLKAEAVIIAIPSLNYKKLRTIYDMARHSGVKTIKVVPSMYVQHAPQISIREFRDISIEDLIGRQDVKVDYEQIGEFIKGKTVLVTGAGGSIGSEIIMQVCSLCPKKIILFDIDETELHSLEMKISRKYKTEKQSIEGISFVDILNKVSFVVGDVRDRERLEKIFKKFSPQIVFHSAAYKHVPMMEYNPEEAVKVNIFGTYNLANVSANYGVEKFIMISTDKVVRPTSVMGLTKRMAEGICMAFNGGETDETKSKRTAFISVRFGNVLGSRGSILPIFLEQLKQGGPITVTHKDMKRYFMTIPEAVALVLQASVIGKGGEVMVLDMGEPVKIVTLAEELINLHGLKPYEDIKIEFTGIRSGENFFEEILTSNEVATRHKKIFVAGNSGKCSLIEIEEILKGLGVALKDDSLSDLDIKEIICEYVKTLN